MAKCAICNEVYYLQNEMDPSEPCACGESAWEVETWRDRLKWLRWRMGMACFWVGDKLLKWRQR